MRIIALRTEATVVREILRALGAPIAPPTIAQAGGPPLWAAMDDAASDAAASDALPATPSPHPHRTSSSISASPGRQASARAAMVQQDRSHWRLNLTPLCAKRLCAARHHSAKS